MSKVLGPQTADRVWFGTYVDNPVLFSERNGYQRVFRLGRWARWRWLKSPRV